MVLTLVTSVEEHRTIKEIHLKLGFAPSLRAAEQSVIVIRHNHIIIIIYSQIHQKHWYM